MPDPKTDKPKNQGAVTGAGTDAATPPPPETDTKTDKPNLAPGTVLDEDEEFETIVVRRKKAARPTGRYVAVNNYRCLMPAKEGDKNAVRDSDGNVLGVPTLLEAGKAYDLPEDIIAHGLKHGALEPEVR